MNISFKISFLTILLLALSRFIPHPPNFTSLLALSFYVPAIFGIKYLFVLLIGFIFTDMIIGLHDTVIFTWGSVIIIGIFSRFFFQTFGRRIMGSLVGALIFFIVTNFGVWSLGNYGISFEGFILCYTLALPFFAYSIISTLIFSIIFELFYKAKNSFIKFA